MAKKQVLIAFSLAFLVATPVLIPVSATGASGGWVKHEGLGSIAAVAVSANGSKLVAAAGGGKIITSVDYGATWTVRESARNWIAVASSSDGTTLVASSYMGTVYTSRDSGSTWSTDNSIENADGVAMSSDGSIFVVGAPAFIYTYGVVPISSPSTSPKPSSSNSSNITYS